MTEKLKMSDEIKLNLKDYFPASFPIGFSLLMQKLDMLEEIQNETWELPKKWHITDGNGDYGSSDSIKCADDLIKTLRGKKVK